jgi:tetratricopeptide (TPR) repeat protein
VNHTVVLVTALVASFCGSLSAAVDADALAGARTLYETGQMTNAQQAFEKLATRDPKDAEVNFYLGELALWRNELPQAVVRFERCVAIAPQVSRYHHRLGDAYGRSAQVASVFSALGFARKCLAAFRRAVELDPNNLDARSSLFMFYRGAPALIGGGADKAAAEAATIKKLDPERGRVVFAALYVSQKKYDRARAELAESKPLDLAAVRSDSIYLSDVAWTDAKVGWGQPTRNYTWFDENNQSGVVLIVHGRLFGRGLYAHSPSRYTYALDGKWKTFTASVGLREGALPQASAVFIVRGDGRELFRSTKLHVNASQRLHLDVEGVKEIELITESGESHNHFSWAIWAEPQLHR